MSPLWQLVQRVISNPLLRRMFVAGLSLGTLFLALRGSDLNEMLQVLARMDWPLLALAVGLEVLIWWFTALRWRRIFAPRPSPGTMRFFWALTVTQLGNTILPGKVGILARIWLIGESMGKTATMCTVILEKTLEALTLAGAFVLLLPFLSSVGQLWFDVLTSTAIVILGLIGLVVVVRWRQPILCQVQRWRWGQAVTGPLIMALDTLAVTQRPAILLELLGWSAWLWVLTVLRAQVLLQATGIAVPLTAAWLLNVVLQVGIRIPALPASIGVFHYAVVVVLTQFAVSESAALSYAVILHGLMFLLPSVVAVGYLWRTGYDWRSWRQAGQLALEKDAHG